MNSCAPVIRPRHGTVVLAPADADERGVLRRVGIAWGLLVLNVLTFYPGYSLAVPIPHLVGQLITQAALPVALLLLLTVNRRVIVRPNVFLFLMSLLVIEAVMTSMMSLHLGTIYRTIRLAEFVAALWLLTPWWGRRDLLFIRYHLASLSVVLGSVFIGLLVDPKAAIGSGRLGGAIWPIPSTEVAHYAAIITGVVLVLWLVGAVRGRVALFVVAVAGTALILSHTRTALIAMVAGLLVACLSLFKVRGRVRKVVATATVGVAIGVATIAGEAAVWLARGENRQGLLSLTGRTEFWAMVVNFPRDKFQEVFGFGLTNGSINGLPIDSNWLVSYMQEGLFGVGVCAAAVLFLLMFSFFRPPGVKRALALFLIIYCLFASITQVGFADATTYLLELFLAASLLVPSPREMPSE